MAEGAGLSVFVLALNEADRIERCLRSVSFAEERIVIVDAATSDDTAERARRLASEVIVRPWEGFAPARRFAVSRARSPWVLWIDADEVVDATLAEEIRRVVRAPQGRAGFRVRRRNHYLGRIVRHGAWSRDTVLRLFLKERARIEERTVHEAVRVDGEVGDLRGHLDHASYRDLEHHWTKILAWSKLWATQAQRDGRRASRLDVIARPPLRFLKGYLLRSGFLDGRAGLVLAFMDAVYVGMKYACLLEMQQRQDEETAKGGES